MKWQEFRWINGLSFDVAAQTFMESFAAAVRGCKDSKGFLASHMMWPQGQTDSDSRIESDWGSSIQWTSVAISGPKMKTIS